VTNDNVVIFAPNQYVLDKVIQNFSQTIEKVINGISQGAFSKLSFFVGGAATTISVPQNSSNSQLNTSSSGNNSHQNKISSSIDLKNLEKSNTVVNHNLNEMFTFDNFVEGKSNQLAKAASRQVAENPGRSYNPLFLYGGVGLGKTHLMHSVGNLILSNKPNSIVVYLHSERFVADMVKALQSNAINEFKRFYRSVDALLIDDIQFFAGKERSQEEFFHTFNAIIDNNKQMVISCDRSPSDLDNIEDRIKSRLGWGLVADVHSTTYELRVGILESKLEQMNINISQNVINFLAAKITSNVRELEGALNKVIAHSTLIGREVTLESTQDILRDLLRSNERIITIEDIQKRVANHYNIKISEMSSVRRARTVVRPRQIAMYLSKILTPKSLADIGSKFGKKDHTTVIHAVKKVEQLMAEDADVREEVNLLTRMLQN
jgi:chromosomal replication initiator protein